MADPLSVLDGNPFFDSDWYRAIVASVAQYSPPANPAVGEARAPGILKQVGGRPANAYGGADAYGGDIMWNAMQAAPGAQRQAAVASVLAENPGIQGSPPPMAPAGSTPGPNGGAVSGGNLFPNMVSLGDGVNRGPDGRPLNMAPPLPTPAKVTVPQVTKAPATANKNVAPDVTKAPATADFFANAPGATQATQATGSQVPQGNYQQYKGLLNKSTAYG